MESLPYLTRKLAPVEVVSAEGLALIEDNAETLLEQVGIEIGNYPEAVEIFRSAGADVTGTRVRFARGMCRRIIQASAPRVFTQRARNPKRDVVIGDPYVVLVPSLRDDRGLPQLREAHLHEPHAPPRRWDAVRAGGSAGQQAPLRHGL
jgi:trimethylamine--corrinoid protein Co-methyltransferase